MKSKNITRDVTPSTRDITQAEAEAEADVQERGRLTRPLAQPVENYRVITKLVIERRKADPAASFTDLKDFAKDECARLRIAYDSEVVGKAVDSALALELT